MKLQTKIGIQLLGGMVGVLLLAQVVPLIQAKRSNGQLAASSLGLLNGRELQNIQNIQTAVQFSVTDSLSRGDMEVFSRVAALQATMAGFVEFSLYNRDGKITDSSSKSSLGHKLEPELKTRLFASSALLVQTNANVIEIYKPLIAGQKCLECHDKFQAGAVCGATYFRFSNDAAAQLAGQFDQITTASNRQSQFLFLGILALGGIVSAGLTLAITRPILRALTRMVSGMKEGANQITAASAETSVASQSLAEGASEQASSLEETSASLEEMASMTKRNSENARQANELAKQARTAADQGVGDMQTMGAAMEAIKVSSDDIAKIIKTIDEIAFQPHSLALNAAVEAARAGEAGMGFAVVADEVRNLAQRSAQAAKETAGKIEGAIIKTGQGVAISSQVAQTLNDIVAKVRQVDELVSEVANASREQTEGITQINVAVGQLDKVTQNNAASAEESAAAAEELNSQSEVMKQSVAELMQLVEGKAEAAPTTVAAAGRRQPVAATAPKAKRLAATNGNGNGHVPKPHANGQSLEARRSEIPMEGDFKDF